MTKTQSMRIEQKASRLFADNAPVPPEFEGGWQKHLCNEDPVSEDEWVGWLLREMCATCPIYWGTK